MSATSEATGGADAPGGARQFVTFRVGPELFGVPLAEVQEIIRMPEVVQVPLAPTSLEGVANLRGAILPITSLRRVFGVEELAHDDATRVVVVRLQDRPAGFVVDRMASVVTAEANEIEDADAVAGDAQGDLLRGVVKRADGMIQLLEPARLVGQMPAAAERAAAVREHRAEVAAASEAPQDDIQLVSFVAAGQEYAFPIEEVQEIVQLPPEVTRVPQAPHAVLGVITLRERLLPLVSLRGLFGLAGDALGESSRIVVVAPEGDAAGRVGVVVDQVREVLRVPRALADPVPPLLADGAEGRLQAICRLDQGRRLAAILSSKRLFRDAGLRAAIEAAGTAGTEDSMGEAQAKQAAAVVEDEQFVVFRLAGEEYGVPTEAVREIVRVPEDLTRIPRTPDFIEGVVNLRGTVLPVVDQRRRFGLPSHERNDRQRIMVLQIAGGRTGFIVDQVTEVLKLPRSAIEAAPELSREQARLIRRVANLEAQKRMVLLLDPAQLLDAGEIDALAAV